MLGEAGTKTKANSGEVMEHRGHRGHREKHFDYLFVRFARFARSVPSVVKSSHFSGFLLFSGDAVFFEWLGEQTFVVQS